MMYKLFYEWKSFWFNKYFSQKAQNYDDRAIEDLLDFYRPLIKAAIRKCIYSDTNYLRFRDDLKSLANLEFIKLIHSHDVSRSFFSYYVSNRLYQNLSKSAKDLLIKSENDQPLEVLFCEMPPLWDPETTDPFGQVELRIIVMEAIKKLDKKSQECINLIFFEQLSQDEASAQLEITQSAFSKRLKKAITQLKKYLSINFEFME